MNRLSNALALTVVVASYGCVGATADDHHSGSQGVASRAEPIQGGEVDRGDPAVGLLRSSGGGLCSGVLISPSVVLTAGHCVTLSDFEGFYTGTGDSTDRLVRHEADDQAAGPDYSLFGGCPNTTGDVGLVHLAAPITDITPVPYAKVAPATSVTCTNIGYGRHTEDGTTTIGIKYSATCTATNTTDAGVLCSWVTGIADKGDSGGPLVCGGTIVAVTSCGRAGTRTAWYGRTDPFADWIDGMVASWPTGP